MSLFEEIQDAADFVRHRFPSKPVMGFVLGSGLGEFAESIPGSTSIPFEEIPHFRKATVSGHSGRLVLGELHSRTLAVLQGRYHYYEGHPMGDVVFPVRVLCALGIETLTLTNAAGGINSSFEPGDLMIIRDHINFMGVNPLAGENDERIGSRFPDMSEIYSEALQTLIAESMTALNLPPRSGVYAAMSGPSYETPAEIRMLSKMGADAVGMSTVPEAIAARHMGVRVAGISCITNMAAGISKTPLDHEEVTRTANRVKKEFKSLVERLVMSVSPQV